MDCVWLQCKHVYIEGSIPCSPYMNFETFIKNKIADLDSKRYTKLQWPDHLGLFLSGGFFLIALEFYAKAFVFLVNGCITPFSLFLFFISYKFLKLAFMLQDDFWYKFQFLKTGKDWEHRYCPQHRDKDCREEDLVLLLEDYKELRKRELIP